MAFSQLGYQYIRPLYPTDRQGTGGGGGSRSGAELSPAGSLCSVLSSMYGAPYAAAAAAQGYGAFLPYAAAELPVFPQLGAQYELKDSPGVQAPAFGPPHPAFYPYGQYQFGDPSRPKNATRESTSTLKAWLNEHRKNPYPTKGEKIMLAIITKMTLTQVSTWFANARRRLKKENKMTWAPRSRSEDEEGTAYGSEDGEADKRDPDDEEIDLENSDSEPSDGTTGAREGGMAGQLLLRVGEDGDRDRDQQEGADQEGAQPAAAAAALRLPSPREHRAGSDTSEDEEEEEEEEEDEESSDGLEELAGAREHFLKAVEARRRASTAPPASPPPLRSPSPAPQPAQPAKPKIWSLAETATSPDNPSRKSPPGGGGGGGGGRGSPPAAPQCLPLGSAPQPAPGVTHRLVSACPLGKFAGWSGRPFSAAPPHASHPLTLLNAPHLLGLAGGNSSTAPAAAAAAAVAALATFSRPADQAPTAEASGTDRSSALDVEKKLIKTAFQPVQRRSQNQLDAAMVLSALSSS